MSELKFIETTDETIYTDILEELENGVGEPLYPGDERRIFGDTMAKVIVAVYNTVNDACRQKMLRYARGTVLDALGENRDVIRLDPTYATTTLRFTVTEAVGSNIIIPAGLRVTGDFVHYFLTDTTAVLYAGSLYAGRRRIRILRRGDRRGKISPRNVTTRAIIMTTQGGTRTWIQETSPPFWREYTRGRIFWTHTTRQQARSGTATT